MSLTLSRSFNWMGKKQKYFPSAVVQKKKKGGVRD